MYSRCWLGGNASNVASAFLFFFSAAASSGGIFTGFFTFVFCRTTLTPSSLSFIAFLT